MKLIKSKIKSDENSINYWIFEDNNCTLKLYYFGNYEFDVKNNAINISSISG